MNIKFSYLYRDGANYKNFNEIVFANPNMISRKETEEIIRKNLIDGKWFISDDWNLPDMHFKEFGYDSEIDHDWHEFESIEETPEAITVENNIEDFLLLVNKTKLPS
jgi:hypothetical protein